MDNETKEILTILGEECAEVIVEISKCMRFGPDQIMSGRELTNLQRLQNEIGDVLAMVELLTDKHIGITTQGLKKAKKSKFEKLSVWSNIKINK